MDINSIEIEKIVRSVLENLDEKPKDHPCKCSGKCSSNHSSGNASAAVLTGERKIDIKEFPLPQISDDEILVKVEGCGICGTDVHEWKGDPFGLIPVILGHEGTGEIVAIGKNIKTDTVGNKLSLGDKIVTSVLICGYCPMCIHHPDKPNLCENSGVYGLFPDDEKYHLNGWFASHIIIRPNSTFFNVSDMSLDERMLIELAAVATHIVGRARSTNLLNFNSSALVLGLGPVGMMVTACLKTAGVTKIFAVDGDENRLAMAKKMGATDTINFKNISSLEERVSYVKSKTMELGVDFAFQCTGAPKAASEIYKYIRRGGGLCEAGFFVDNGDSVINPHHDLCNKEITLVGSWVYGALEYPQTIAFIKRAKEIGIPLVDMITHKYPLHQLNEAMETNLSMKGVKIAMVNEA